MKILFLIFNFMMINTAYGGLNCSPVKTSWYLYKAQSSAKEIITCTDPKCLIKKTLKAEKNFCKAMKKCPDLGEELENPCTVEGRLTPEAREYILTNAENGFELILDEAIKWVDSVRGGNDEEAPQEETNPEEPEALE